MTDLDKITKFLSSIGFSLEKSIGLVSQDTFIKGILIKGMGIEIDLYHLKYVGDVLHEAGHVAVTPSIFRPFLFKNINSINQLVENYMKTHSFLVDYEEDPIIRGILQMGESEAMAWSYAAAIACDIDPRIVFHDGGYDGDGEMIVQMMNNRSHFGINGLQAGKMTTVKTFPNMIRWLQV